MQIHISAEYRAQPKKETALSMQVPVSVLVAKLRARSARGEFAPPASPFSHGRILGAVIILTSLTAPCQTWRAPDDSGPLDPSTYAAASASGRKPTRAPGIGRDDVDFTATGSSARRLGQTASRREALEAKFETEPDSREPIEAAR
jgi:hypothetical protein